MTLLQLKYVVGWWRQPEPSAGRQKLYIAQPSLTAAIKELEHRLIFPVYPHELRRGDFRMGKRIWVCETGDRAGKP